MNVFKIKVAKIQPQSCVSAFSFLAKSFPTENKLQLSQQMSSLLDKDVTVLRYLLMT